MTTNLKVALDELNRLHLKHEDYYARLFEVLFEMVKEINDLKQQIKELKQ